MFFSRPNGSAENIFEGFLAVRTDLPKTFLKVFVDPEYIKFLVFIKLILHGGVGRRFINLLQVLLRFAQLSTESLLTQLTL